MKSILTVISLTLFLYLKGQVKINDLKYVTLVKSIESSSPLYPIYKGALLNSNLSLPSADKLSSNFIFNNRIYGLKKYDVISDFNVQLSQNRRLSLTTNGNGKSEKIISCVEENSLIGYSLSQGKEIFKVPNPLINHNQGGWILYADPEVIFYLIDSTGKVINGTGSLILQEKWYKIYKLKNGILQLVYKAEVTNDHYVIQDTRNFSIDKIGDNSFLFASVRQRNVLSVTRSATFIEKFTISDDGIYSMQPLYIFENSTFRRTELDNSQSVSYSIFKADALLSNYNVEKIDSRFYFIDIDKNGLNFKSHNFEPRLNNTPISIIGEYYVLSSEGLIYLSKDLIKFFILGWKNSSAEYVSNIFYAEHLRKYFSTKEIGNKIYIYEIKVQNILTN